jgi:hypothetical protein
MRAADADREQVAARLREALDEGRFTLDEYDERVREAYAAKTFGELDRLVADLPTPRPPEQSQLAPISPTMPVPPSRHEPNPKLAPWLSWLWRIWLGVVILNVAIWFLVSLASLDPVYFWPIWVAGPWAAVNIALTIIFPPNRRRS